ncbi:MAG: ribonuclease HII [Bacteroidetes bacterium]|nr:ribonuclease HII [Bacteroidota bacterium]
MLLSYHAAGKLEAGCDEAGRGCLAGPVFAAAVILPERYELPWLNDSKQLSETQREQLRPLIEKQALAWAVAQVDLPDIEHLNILWAAVKAMHLAVKSLSTQPEFLLIDGNRFKPYPGIPHQCIVGGDGKYAAIAAASILAKTHRDAYMLQLHDQYPQYNWHDNKGYGTLAHRSAIAEHGLSPYHRRGFKMSVPEQGKLFREK